MQSMYEYVLRAFIFLGALRALTFLHALHTLILSSALRAFIFDVHYVPSLFLSVSNFWRTLCAFTSFIKCGTTHNQ